MENAAKFALCLFVLCLLCPPLWGFVIGVSGFCALWWVVYKVIGG